MSGTFISGVASRWTFALALGLAAASAAPQARGQDVPRDASPGFVIPVPPGKRLAIRVSFSADWEHQVELSDPFGAVVFRKNNFDPGWAEYVTMPNPTGQPVLYRVHDFHKKSAPDGDLPWHVSPLRPLRDEFYARGYGVIGFDDGGGDFRFTNAVIECRIID